MGFRRTVLIVGRKDFADEQSDVGLVRVAHAAVELHGIVGDHHSRVGSACLCPRNGQLCLQRARIAVEHERRLVERGPRHFQLNLQVREAVPHSLERAYRLTELPSVLDIVQSGVERLLHGAEQIEGVGERQFLVNGHVVAGQRLA